MNGSISGSAWTGVFETPWRCATMGSPIMRGFRCLSGFVESYIGRFDANGMSFVPRIARPIAGIVLAGGAGTRIGGEKPHRLFAGRPLIAHVVDRLAPQVAALAIGAGEPAAFAPFGLPVLPDPVPGRAGPLAGVAAGLAWAKQVGGDRLLTAPCDTPFLPADLAVRLAAADAEIVVAASGGRLHYTVALWRVALADGLAADVTMGRAVAMHRWLSDRQVIAVTFDGTPDPFFNINTAADLAAASARWKYCADQAAST